jgi:hypothetical protein
MQTFTVFLVSMTKSLTVHSNKSFKSDHQPRRNSRVLLTDMENISMSNALLTAMWLPLLSLLVMTWTVTAQLFTLEINSFTPMLNQLPDLGIPLEEMEMLLPDLEILQAEMEMPLSDLEVRLPETASSLPDMEFSKTGRTLPIQGIPISVTHIKSLRVLPLGSALPVLLPMFLSKMDITSLRALPLGSVLPVFLPMCLTDVESQPHRALSVESVLPVLLPMMEMATTELSMTVT